MQKLLFLVLTAVIVWAGCESDTSQNNQAADTLTAGSEQEVPPSNEQNSQEKSDYLITEQSFEGLTVGQPITEIADQVEKGKLENGEGEFDVYYLKAENGQPLAYFHPDPNDNTRIGDLVITSELPQTKEGLQVGMTYAEIESKIKPFEVHGSEIESRTAIFYKQWALGLDYPSTDYDLDRNEIPKEAKVTNITIRRSIN